MSEPTDPAYPPLPPAPGYAGYGAMPPAEYGQPVLVGPAPSSVMNAVRLMFVAATLGVVSLIVALSTKSTLRSAIVKKNPDFDSQKINTAVNVAIVAGVVFGIVFITLFVLLALQVRRVGHRQRARVPRPDRRARQPGGRTRQRNPRRGNRRAATSKAEQRLLQART
jgi:hypothetical protein